MREISTSVTFELGEGEVVPMRIGRSVKLSVQGAPVWATRSIDTRDYWLQPGETLRLRTGERLWLSTEDGRRAQVVFNIAPRPGSQAIGWLAGRIDRMTNRFRSGWRVI